MMKHWNSLSDNITMVKDWHWNKNLIHDYYTKIELEKVLSTHSMLKKKTETNETLTMHYCYSSFKNGVRICQYMVQIYRKRLTFCTWNSKMDVTLLPVMVGCQRNYKNFLVTLHFKHKMFKNLLLGGDGEIRNETLTDDEICQGVLNKS